MWSEVRRITGGVRAVSAGARHPRACWWHVTGCRVPADAGRARRNAWNFRPRPLACARVTPAYARLGSGPPLLLVHGLGSCKEMWRPLLPALAREREVVAVDLPGFGASPPGPRTVEGLAEALAAFAAELGLERPHVAGNSLGGGVALVMGSMGVCGSVCAVSPIGFMVG